MRRLEIVDEAWPIMGDFRIARGVKIQAKTVMVCLSEGHNVGRGEAVPYARYGESMQSVRGQIEALRGALEQGLSREDLQSSLPAGAARNALDCALWDLQAKSSGVPVWQRAGLAEPKPVQTAFTLGLDTPKGMAEKAGRAKAYPLLKLKLAGDGADLQRLLAIRDVRKDARFILDANEGLSLSQLKSLLPDLCDLNVVLIEQPLPADDDAALEGFASPIALCADESLHTTNDLARVAGRYDAVNIKLDKTGGLSEALTLASAAKAQGLQVMLGCMVGTSLGMAPSLLLGAMTDYVDLDGPLLLQKDRAGGLAYEGALVSPPLPELWG
jgi:L-Ala-D/L-Glu epimerase / N-acetyl-D-glutamate racemase